MNIKFLLWQWDWQQSFKEDKQDMNNNELELYTTDNDISCMVKGYLYGCLLMLKFLIWQWAWEDWYVGRGKTVPPHYRSFDEYVFRRFLEGKYPNPVQFLGG
jgi:hypothetical protein